MIQTFNEAMNLLHKTGDPDTPAQVIDLDQVRKDCKQFITEFGKGNVFFSMKANSHPAVIRTLFNDGINFDLASWGEAEILLQQKVPVERMIFSAPTKIPDHIRRTYEHGIRTYSFDSKIEVEKLAKLAPGAKVFARLSVRNTGSEWPLEKKFGISDDEAVELLVYAKMMGLIPWGLTFHVGSQNSRPESWRDSLLQTAGVVRQLAKKGIRIKAINAGGGSRHSIQRKSHPCWKLQRLLNRFRNPNLEKRSRSGSNLAEGWWEMPGLLQQQSSTARCEKGKTGSM